jgi:hypothetical protein
MNDSSKKKGPPKEIHINPMQFTNKMSIYTYKPMRVYQASTEKTEGTLTYVLKTEK